MDGRSPWVCKYVKEKLACLFEDLFYFVMLTIEQLDVDIEKTTLKVYGDNTEIRFEDIYKTFTPYIAEIADSTEAHSIFHIAKQCV